MNAKRNALLATLFATTTAVPTHAGCLDWLFSKPAAPVYPYAAGYAPQATVTPIGPPVPMGAPVTQYAAAYAPQTNPYAVNPYAANYAGTLPAIAAQAPAYGAAIPGYGVAIPNSAGTAAYSLPYDNPSVLTGQPVMQTSAMQPVGLYGVAPALPPAAYGPPPQAPGSGSFFSRMFGNDYQTSYYGVPTTTYRPVTQVDPATGQLVTVQQPCTSMTQQVQRSPYTTLQPAAPVANPYYAEPTCGSEPPRYAPPTTYAPAPSYAPAANYAPQAAYPANGYAAPSAVSQAAAPAYGAPGYASPIPSTSPYGQPAAGQSSYNALPAYPAPSAPAASTTQPLSGYPDGYPYNYGTGSAATGDAAVVPQPQMDALRPAWTSPAIPSTAPSTSYPSTTFPSTTTPSSSGTLQAPPLLPPSASTWPTDRTPTSASPNVTAKPVPASGTMNDKYSDIAPIPAPDEYHAPAWTDLYQQKPNARAVDSGSSGERWRETTPATRVPSNASLGEPRTASNEPARAEGSLQYASTPALPTLPAKPAPRDDSGWFPIQEP